MNEVSAMIEYAKSAAIVLNGDRRGVTAVEYALIAGVLVAGIALAFGALTGNLKTFLSGIGFSYTSSS
jgi:Flp pilus assembly pilin Flp